MRVIGGSLLAISAALASPAAGQHLEVSALAAQDHGVIIVTGMREGYSVEETSTATRTPTPLNDVPQAISIVTEEQIDDQAMRSIGDVLRYVPGAMIGQGEGHRDQVTLRGNNSTADFFVDGLRDDVQYYRGLYNVERVEVLKGPNAMIFGRGGGGGVINRVTKRPVANPFVRGSFGADTEGAWLADVDLNQPLSSVAAARLNAVYERFDNHRQVFEGKRYAINPTGAVTISDNSRIDLSYEYAKDDRVVDRGVPSLSGRPLPGHRDTFFGDPDVNDTDFDVHLLKGRLEHRLSDAANVTSRILYGDYDKLYQNVFPATAVTTVDGVQGFGVEAYRDGMQRKNLISQTDLILKAETGALSHTILAGFEFADQDTGSQRINGLFDPETGTTRVTRRRVALSNTIETPPVTEWRLARSTQGDADVLAVYFQDQVSIGRYFDIIGGIRFDRFSLEIDNIISGQSLSRTDELWSPRLGAVAKPMESLSLYASYSRSYLPQSGDQFTLDVTSAALAPERFDNYELGLKWDIRLQLSFTAAIYQLDRSNTRANDPENPGSVVLTGEQRSKGLELGLAGEISRNWKISAGYALQDAEITRTTQAAPEGREVPQVPRHQASFWTRYDFTGSLGAGLGIYHQSRSFASISNAVVLPSFTRIDAAIFARLSDRISAQLNVENFLGEDYFFAAHNDNNITPGAPLTARATIRLGF